VASTSETRVYSALFSTTLDDHRSELVDQVHAGIPLLWYMKNKGRGRDQGGGRGIRFQRGGAKIKIPLVWAQNSNVKTYSRFENLDVNATDEITVGIDVLRQLGATVGISGEELDQNQGLVAKRDLLRDKLDIAELSMKENLEQQLVEGIPNNTPTDTFMTSGNSGKDMIPLGTFMKKGWTDNNTVHEIDDTDETWWRNQVSQEPQAGVLTLPQLIVSMNNIYNDCSKGSTNDHPDLIISDQFVFELYEGLLAQQQRYGNYGDEDAASAGFLTVKFKGALWFWSQFMPGHGTGSTANCTASSAVTGQAANPSSMFFINSRWLELVVSERVNFVATPFVEPYDQDAIWAKILLRAQMIVKQRRKFGLYYDAVTVA
jgi:hypothetical protein